MRATSPPMQTADDVLRAAELCLSVDHADHSADACRRHVHELVVAAGLGFARAGRMVEAFKLMSSVHLGGTWSADVFRLRNALLRYEQKRIARVRRRLVYVLLAVLG